jgi:hypothetical protein
MLPARLGFGAWMTEDLPKNIMESLTGTKHHPWLAPPLGRKDNCGIHISLKICSEKVLNQRLNYF